MREWDEGGRNGWPVKSGRVTYVGWPKKADFGRKGRLKKWVYWVRQGGREGIVSGYVKERNVKSP